MQKDDLLVFYNLSQYPELKYGLSTKEDGTMKPADTASSRAHTKERREEYFLKQGVFPHQVISAGLVHGTTVTVVSLKDAGATIPDTDSLVTAEPHLFLSVTVADCFPVFIYDPKHQIVALVHAGWRGIVENIIPKTLKEMQERWGTTPDQIVIAIGPGIQKCHFVFENGALEKFEGYEEQISRNDKGEITVDLPGVIAKQATGLGVVNIETCEICTFCHPSTYYSYRRDKPESVQAMAAFIGRA